MPLANCEECGKLYQQFRSKRCPECKKAREKEVDDVKRFLRRNPGAAITEVSEGTDIEEEKILDFIREGDIELVKPPVDMQFNCEVCGSVIPAGRKCQSCQDKFVTQFKKAAGNYDPSSSGTSDRSSRKSNRMYTADSIRKKEEK